MAPTASVGVIFLTWERAGLKEEREASPCSDRGSADVGADVFHRGLCLPSDNKMTPEEQDIVIAMIRSCFD